SWPRYPHGPAAAHYGFQNGIRCINISAYLSQLAKTSPDTLRHSKFVQVDRLAKNEVLEVIAEFPRLSPLTRRPRVLSCDNSVGSSVSAAFSILGSGIVAVCLGLSMAELDRKS